MCNIWFQKSNPQTDLARHKVQEVALQCSRIVEGVAVKSALYKPVSIGDRGKEVSKLVHLLRRGTGYTPSGLVQRERATIEKVWKMKRSRDARRAIREAKSIWSLSKANEEEMEER